MPRPNKDENREAYLHRFMGSAEAIKDYPDDKQRFAVAVSLWEHRNTLEEFGNSMGYTGERDGAEPFGGRHIQTGIVGYPEMKHPHNGKQGIDILVEKEVLDAMRPTMRGIPILNWEHAQGDYAKWIAEGKAKGMVVGSHWNGDDAWEHCNYFVWDKEAKANCRNGFRLSNAWKEDEIDWTPGIHNGKSYDGKLKAAHYTHMAIVPNPRYEGAIIYQNSKGGFTAMLNLLGFGSEKPIALDKDASLKVGDKQYSVLEVVNSLAKIEAEKAKVSSTAKDGEVTDKDTIEVNGKKYTGLEVKNALAALIAKPAEEKKAEVEEPIAKEDFENAVKERLDKALEDLKGHAFFNTIAELAKSRPSGTKESPRRNDEKSRLELGRKRYGARKPVGA